MRFLSMLLILAVSMTQIVRAETPSADPELWSALREIHLRQKYLKQAEVGMQYVAASVGSIILAQTVGSLVPKYRGYVKGASRALGIAAASGTLVTAYYARGARRNGWIYSQIAPSLDDGWILEEGFDVLNEFFKLPLLEQYERASVDKDLRNYILAVDQWLAQRVTTNPPPRLHPGP